MPAKKRPARPKAPPTDPSGPAWLVILEDIRSQNRLTIETVEARHDEMRRELQNFRGEVRADMSVLRTIVQGQSIDIRDLKTGLARVETKVDQLGSIEARVATLERRRA